MAGDLMMKAWRFYGFGDMRLDEIPVPALGRARPCSDPLRSASVDRGAARRLAFRHSHLSASSGDWKPKRPYNCSGMSIARAVLEIGEGVTDFVLAIACRPRPSCVRRMPPLYRRPFSPVPQGSDHRVPAPGLLSEYAMLPEIALHASRDRISDSEAACLQSLRDSVAAAKLPASVIGDAVAIFGQGSMGLECMQIARASGAGRIIAIESAKKHCAMARELGADHVINAAQDDPVAAIQELTGGNGADVVFECAGGSPKQGLAGTRTLMLAIDSVRSGGTLVGVSWFGGPIEFPVDVLRERSLRY